MLQFVRLCPFCFWILVVLWVAVVATFHTDLLCWLGPMGLNNDVERYDQGKDSKQSKAGVEVLEKKHLFGSDH